MPRRLVWSPSSPHWWPHIRRFPLLHWDREIKKLQEPLIFRYHFDSCGQLKCGTPKTIWGDIGFTSLLCLHGKSKPSKSFSTRCLATDPDAQYLTCNKFLLQAAWARWERFGDNLETSIHAWWSASLERVCLRVHNQQNIGTWSSICASVSSGTCIKFGFWQAMPPISQLQREQDPTCGKSYKLIASMQNMWLITAISTQVSIHSSRCICTTLKCSVEIWYLWISECVLT